MRKILLPFALLLNACMPVTHNDTATRAIAGAAPLPAMKTFATPHPVQTAKSNADLAQDFLELSFELESGRALPVFTRFEGPISVRIIGAPPLSLGSDLNRLIGRLRTEAQIDITRTTSPQANITIQAVSRQQIRNTLPDAACFVVPNVTSLDEYRALRRSPRTSWTSLQTRERLAIFLPNDASPQEARDCLHEELAQAIGPLNDLYRLPDSVFNDDNVHTVLTGFDMMILRAYYAPDLQSGMSRAQVAARLPQVLARINPDGQGRPIQPVSRTPRAWSDAVQSALGPGATPNQRRTAAADALNIAKQMGWTDHRRAFAHYANGRLLMATDPDAAQLHFAQADRFYAATPGAELHRAYVATQLAAYAITQGDGDHALRLIEPQLALATSHENAALLSTLLMLRAEALALTGQSAEARTVRVDSLGWARYGFGPDWAVRAKEREIASLNPLN
ncbi:MULTISPECIES: DUF2927 domain-containing protein [Roseobacteraceae]|uniref:ATP-dependent transcriptional regulator n=1 Tax=Pseudosulfitobacter pseudonitzschiae TaxID=1402135 RepID=A0A221JZD0_9RHOB|nr:MULTISPECIES: DUF2927 domain-containing protein [Roseobacteraceae]ASM72086.1 ATP-dependent transcriptional regulator [Pseudosulfitobacter pseudonitzschiae]